MLIIALIVAAALLLAIAAFVRTRKPCDISSREVAAALANALDLDGSGNHDEFDLFLGRPISDPHLESLRVEIIEIATSEGQPIPGRDFGPLAEAWLRRVHAELTRDGT